MASLHYLWSNRAKFRVVSKLYFRAWAKRILTLPELLKRNYRRISLVNRGATIHECAEIGQSKIEGKINLLSIGNSTFIGQAEIALHDKVAIGSFVCINDGVVILTASHDVSDPEWKHKKSPVIIEDYVWIATNAIVLPGVTLGRGAVVGAGAVVHKSISAGAVVAGNPAVVLSSKRTNQLNYNPCEFLAANQAWLKG